MKKYLLLLSLVALFASCKKNDGTVISGHVTFWDIDHYGFVDSTFYIAGEKVLLDGNGIELLVTTDSNGYYKLPPVKKGTWRISVSHKYYSTWYKTEVKVTVYHNANNELVQNIEITRHT